MSTVDIGDFAASLVVERYTGNVVDEPREEAVFKVTLIGDTGVGKSSLLYRALRNQFNDTCQSTIGVEFASFTYRVSLPDVQTRVVKLQVWDTAGQERFRAITSAYYRGTQAVIFVYSITQDTSFASIDKWVEECENHTAAGDIPPLKVLVANKTDMAHLRTVDTDSLAARAKQDCMLPVETSAKDATNVTYMMETLVRVLSQGLFAKQPVGTKKVDGALHGQPVAVPEALRPEAARPKLRIVDPSADGTATPARTRGGGCAC